MDERKREEYTNATSETTEMIHRLTIGCKINLYLEITGVRPDGYHELDTLFYPCPEPHDTLELEMTGGEGGLVLTCSDPALETPSNLAARAYEAFGAATGWRPALRAHLVKRIPSGAGLGGGSADAAALLGWLNARAEKALSKDALAALAATLGADVPFFLENRPARARGRGDILTPADVDLSGLTLVVAVPPERVSTAWAYAKWDEAKAMKNGRNAGKLGDGIAASFLTNLRGPDMRTLCVNCFEPVVFETYPAVRKLKERLLALGAVAAGMSGSGSAVFGIFRHSAQADAALSALVTSGTAVFSALL